MQTLHLERDASALARVGVELTKARARFSDFNSVHEGYAVLLEEMDELWEVVRTKSGDRTRAQLQEEAIQIAAMAIRFLVDVADKANPVTDDLLNTLGEVDREVNARMIRKPNHQ